MRIVEISDYTMVIMKDSDDPPWYSIGNFGDWPEKYRHMVFHAGILSEKEREKDWVISESFLCTGGKLILYFKDPLPDRFHKGDKIFVFMTLIE